MYTVFRSLVWAGIAAACTYIIVNAVVIPTLELRDAVKQQMQPSPQYKPNPSIRKLV